MHAGYYRSAKHKMIVEMNRTIYFLLCSLLLYPGCTPSELPYEPASPVKDIVIEDLRRPWGMAFLSEYEALITEKDGDLLRVQLETGERTIIQGIPEDRADSVITKPEDATSLHYPRGIQAGIKTTFNEGLLDVILDPDFSTNRRLFLSYVSESDSGTTTKVISARLNGDALSDIHTLLLATPYSDGSFHYGGALAFGNDGMLYVSVGDRLFSEANQPLPPTAQDLTDPRGMIHRFNPDGSIPGENPDLGPHAVPSAFASGIRNVQGMAVHPTTGELWFSEHGTIQGDELNLLEAGANYGWPLETSGRYRAPNYAPSIPDNVTLTPPKWYWQHTVAPTGLVFYTGTEFPEWHHNLLLTGLSGGSLWRFRIEGEAVKSAEELFLDERDRARNIALSPGGTLYVITDAPNGKLLRIRNANAVQ